MPRLSLPPILAGVCTWALLGVCAAPARADNVTVKLNFATANQSQWTAGPAFIRDASLAIPDPALSGSINLGNIDMDPFSAALDFIGNLLDINLSTGAHISPVADFSVGLEAGYHVNSGSLDLDYPMKAQINLPDVVDAGTPFDVSVTFPTPGGVSPLQMAASGLTSLQSSFQNAGGSGYSNMNPFLTSAANIGLFDLTPGFNTTFPYAEAHLNLNLSASGALRAEACVFLLGCAGDDLNIGGVNLSQQLFGIDTRTGIEVLDQPFVSFNGTVNLPFGLGSLDYASPNINVDGTRRSDGTMAGGGSSEFLNAAFDVGQLIPLVGQILHNNIGVFGYDLLSFEPTISLTLNQSLTFDPQLMVALQFSDPVLYGGNATRTVVMPVGGPPVSLEMAGIGRPGSDVTVKPTFFLDNTFHNNTWINVALGYDVTALELTAPVEAGPAFEDHVDFADFDFFTVNDSSFQVYVPPITTSAQTFGRTGSLQALLSAAVNVGVDPNDQGDSQFTLNFADGLSATAFGRIERLQPPGLNQSCLNFDIDVCEKIFVADDDVAIGINGNIVRSGCRPRVLHRLLRLVAHHAAAASGQSVADRCRQRSGLSVGARSDDRSELVSGATDGRGSDCQRSGNWQDAILPADLDHASRGCADGAGAGHAAADRIGPADAGASAKRREGAMTRTTVSLVAGVAIGVVCGFLMAGTYRTHASTAPSINTEYALVLLDNSQAYLGKLQNLGEANPTLRDVFYIQDRPILKPSR